MEYRNQLNLLTCLSSLPYGILKGSLMTIMFCFIICSGFSQEVYCDAKIITDIKKVRVIFHFLTDSTQSGNFTKCRDKNKINGRKWAKMIISKANEQLANLHPNWKSPEGSDHVKDAGFRYVLKRVKYHEDNELAVIDNYTERAKADINDKYGVKLNKFLNVYFYKDYWRGIKNGGGLTNRGTRKEQVLIKMHNYGHEKYLKYNNEEWILREEAAVFNHEVGHLLGLEHDWMNNDRVKDTKSYKDRQCKGNKGEWDNCSNNFMSIPATYSSLEGSFTPCQVLRMHEFLDGKRKIYVSYLQAKNRKLIRLK